MGPSGAGKSFLGEQIAQLLNYVHIEGDDHEGENPIDVHGLRDAWDHFYPGNNFIPLRDILRIKAGSLPGTVLTLPSLVLPRADLLQNAVENNLLTIIVFGSAAECLDSFLAREQATGRNLDEQHWLNNNHHTYLRCSLPEYADFRLSTFINGQRRSAGELVNEISERF